MNHQSHHHHHLTCQVNKQTNIQTRPIKLPHHIHHPKRLNWFTPEWLTPWVTTNHHHRQSDIATDMIRNYLHTHLNTHQKVTHHQLYHANISAHHQILEYQKGSTSASQNTSFKASTQQNQSQTECKSKANVTFIERFVQFLPQVS